jgi:hypothetical protein
VQGDRTRAFEDRAHRLVCVGTGEYEGMRVGDVFVADGREVRRDGPKPPPSLPAVQGVR